MLDIVNLDDQVIGQKYRTEIYAQKSSNFRVINAFLINSSNQVWIPRRSPLKKLFPSCLDASVGGHVMAGETYEAALAREVEEELNMKVTDFAYKLLAKLNPHQHAVSAYMHVYIILTDDEPSYNTNDFIAAQWYNMHELQEIIKSGEPTKGDLPALINLLRCSL